MTSNKYALLRTTLAAGVAVAMAICVGCDGNQSGAGVAKAGDTPAVASAKGKPNIVLISLCSVRADHMSLYGYARRTTPSFEALARESYVFDHAYTQWPKTAPAFAAIMSAKYGHTNGVMRITPGQFLADEHKTLCEVLNDAGYQTAAFVSTAAVNSETNINQGFQTFEEVWRDASGRANPQRHIAPTIRAIDYIEQHKNDDKPFFVWAHYNNAHYYYDGGGVPPETFVDDDHMGPSEVVELRRNPLTCLDIPADLEDPCYRPLKRPDIGGLHRGAIQVDLRAGGRTIHPRATDLAYSVAVYDAGILGGDRAAGALIEELRDLKLMDNTIVVLVGDHGESLGDQNFYMEHGRFPYDSTARVPYMIRPVGGVKEERIDAPVASFSLAPTLLDMIGVAKPEEWEAQSVYAALTSDEKFPRWVYTESGYEQMFSLTIRDNQWKLIWVPDETDQLLQRNSQFELYDWRADPTESKNVVTSHKDEFGQLVKKLQQWRQPWYEQAAGLKSGGHAISSQNAKGLKGMGYIGGADDIDPAMLAIQDVSVASPDDFHRVGVVTCPNPGKPEQYPN
ncbi:MAG: sulfatase [Phycisphaerales bacterium]|nr:sulfatase [Phycisphaerales bacterium]